LNILQNLGLIWEKRSITPGTPKSGEHELQIDPIALALKKHSTVSI